MSQSNVSQSNVSQSNVSQSNQSHANASEEDRSEVDRPTVARRLGDFRFEAETGLLVDDRDGTSQRLAPQPAALLTLLIGADGALVPRDEIRTRIWGETVIDFDQALHFCVRQVRAALGDDAAAPRYVETLPRRGYRLLMPADPIGPDPSVPGTSVPGTSVSGTQQRGTATSGSHAPTESLADRATPMARHRILVGGAGLVLSLLAMAAIGLRFAPIAEPSVPTVAILAFAPSAAVDRAAPTTSDAGLRIAHGLLARLGAVGASELGVIGPSTTAAYGPGFDAVRRAVRELGVDWVLGGRWLPNEAAAAPDLIVELIRATDGVHVWVEKYASPIDVDRVVADAAEATVGAVSATVASARAGR